MPPRRTRGISREEPQQLESEIQSMTVPDSISPSDWNEIKQLKTHILALEEKVGELEEVIGAQEVIVLRTVDRDTAKQEIRELFQGAESLYFSDIAKRLRLELPLVVEICQELIEEEEIEVNDDTA